jgi:hypothetical protein
MGRKLRTEFERAVYRDPASWASASWSPALDPDNIEPQRRHSSITEHDKLPDIILYKSATNRLFLIEAVTTHGPVNPKRHAEIETMLSGCPAERVYVTAFLDKADFRKYAADIAWETEVWIAETPDHMIHFNGPKFLGPYKRAEN